MSAFSNLLLKNQAATEVTFAPADINPSTKVVRWMATGSSFDARPYATLSIAYPSGSATKVKVKGKVSIPVMDVNDTSVRTDEIIGLFEISLPKNAVLADRQNLRAYLADFLIDATVVSAVENFESVY